MPLPRKFEPRYLGCYSLKKAPKSGKFFLRSLGCLLFNSMLERVCLWSAPTCRRFESGDMSPQSIKAGAAPAGWRGSAAAFHAGTRHPQNPPDKGGYKPKSGSDQRQIE
jgi:hypothetical protein